MKQKFIRNAEQMKFHYPKKCADLMTTIVEKMENHPISFVHKYKIQSYFIEMRKTIYLIHE